MGRFGDEKVVYSTLAPNIMVLTPNNMRKAPNITGMIKGSVPKFMQESLAQWSLYYEFSSGYQQ